MLFKLDLSKKASSLSDIKVSNNKVTLLPRLVANGTQLVKSWEDQYYVVNEYRANAHHVGSISSKYSKGL